MRLATWNVNGLRARIDYIDHWLKDRQPDVVGLQELKTPDDVFLTTTSEHSATRRFTGRKVGTALRSWPNIQ